MSSTRAVGGGHIVDEHDGVTLTELCHLYGVQTRTVVALVREGVLEPVTGGSRADWRFAASSVSRLGLALRLRRQLHLDLVGTAVALDLLDEVDRLRQRVSVLESLLEPAPLRRRR